jgi:hypothetical protein
MSVAKKNANAGRGRIDENAGPEETAFPSVLIKRER